MLAGRAWQFSLFPFTHTELGSSFRLDDILLRGSLPPVIHDDLHDTFQTLKTYTLTYLKEELLDEALTRNISAFSRFLDLAADQSGKIVNFSTISRETGVTSKTIKGYYQDIGGYSCSLKDRAIFEERQEKTGSPPKVLPVRSRVC